MLIVFPSLRLIKAFINKGERRKFLPLRFLLTNADVLRLSCLPFDPLPSLFPHFCFSCFDPQICLAGQTLSGAWGWRQSGLMKITMFAAQRSQLWVWEGACVCVCESCRQEGGKKSIQGRKTGTNQCDYKGHSLCCWIDFEFSDFLLRGNTDWFFPERPRQTWAVKSTLKKKKGPAFSQFYSRADQI